MGFSRREYIHDSIRMQTKGTKTFLCSGNWWRHVRPWPQQPGYLPPSPWTLSGPARQRQQALASSEHPRPSRSQQTQSWKPEAKPDHTKALRMLQAWPSATPSHGHV